MQQDDEGVEFAVVCNEAEQYSIWPVGSDLPSGWRESGWRGPRIACLDYIERMWTRKSARDRAPIASEAPAS